MYPDQELILLAGRKAELQRAIARRRVTCAGAAAGVAQPLAWLDRMVAFWRRVSPFALLAAVPLGWVLKRSPVTRKLGAWLRWGPLLFGAVRSLAGARTRTPHG